MPLARPAYSPDQIQPYKATAIASACSAALQSSAAAASLRPELPECPAAASYSPAAPQMPALQSAAVVPPRPLAWVQPPSTWHDRSHRPPPSYRSRALLSRRARPPPVLLSCSPPREPPCSAPLKLAPGAEAVATS